jgi:hypothetical protein
MLSDDPWSLVESFPRRQGLPVPSGLGTQPARSKGLVETREVGTNTTASHGPSANRSLGPLPYRYQGAHVAGSHAARNPSSTWNHGPDVNRDHAASNHQVPWDLVFPVLGPPWSLAASTIKPDRGPGARVPGYPATEVPMIPRRPCGQAAAGNSAPSSHRPPWSLALMGPSLTRVSGPHRANVPHAA